MKKKSKLSREQRSLAGILAVQSAPVVKINAPYERGTGLQKFTRQYEVQIAAEEQARKDAAGRPIRAAEAQLNDSLRQLREAQAQSLLSGTSEEFLSRTTPIADEDVVDVAGQPLSFETVRQRIQNALDGTALALENAGIRFTDEGRKRLQSIARLAPYHGVNWMLAENWQALFTYADEVGLMTERECSRTQAAQPQPVVVEQPIDLLAALEAQPDTHEGRKRARELGNQHLFSVEAKSVFDEWLASLSNNFDFVPNEEKQHAALDFFIERNLGFLDRRAYDTCRKAMVARGVFPERCLTNADRAELLVESSHAQTYAEKQELKRKLALLNK